MFFLICGTDYMALIYALKMVIWWLIIAYLKVQSWHLAAVLMYLLYYRYFGFHSLVSNISSYTVLTIHLQLLSLY